MRKKTRIKKKIGEAIKYLEGKDDFKEMGDLCRLAIKKKLEKKRLKRGEIRAISYAVFVYANFQNNSGANPDRLLKKLDHFFEGWL